MKKSFILFLICILTFTCFVSCKNAEDSFDNENMICVPVFFEGGAIDKGLHVMSAKNQHSPFDDFGVAQGVMTTLPLLSGFRDLDIKKNNVQDTINGEVDDVVYPFGFKAVLSKKSVNEDGYYLHYDCYDDFDGEDVWFGFFDFYYKIRKGQNPVFSYREAVLATIEGDFTLLTIEYKDVEITHANKKGFPEFAVGQYNATTGKLDTNAWVSQIGIQLSTFFDDPDTKYEFYSQIGLAPLTAKSDGTNYASFSRVYDGYSEQCGYHYNTTSKLNAIMDVLRTKSGTQLQGQTVVTANDESARSAYNNSLKELKFDDIFGMYDILLGTDDNFTDRLNTTYTSYEEYTADSIIEKMYLYNNSDYSSCTKNPDELKDDIAIYRYEGTPACAATQNAYKLYHSMFDGDAQLYDTADYCVDVGMVNCPILANLSNASELITQINNFECDEIGALFPDQRYSEGQYYFTAPFTSFAQFEGYPKTEQDYTTLDSQQKKEARMAYQEELMKAHLKQCGITNTSFAENYAKNFIYSQNNLHFLIPVTGEAFDTFKVAYDTAHTQHHQPQE